ncbi:MAG TPA: sugar ABC transporter permease [Clostridiaceae bacterium]|nr:sugar ABC transporter permease [Clostridiaceae bacterium]
MRVTTSNRINKISTNLKNNDTMRMLIKNRYIYLMILPVTIHYIVFSYFPMYGIIIAFKDFKASLGIIRSPWVGFAYFREFFSSYYFWRLIRNNLLLNIYLLIFAFPAPIVLALLLNEIDNLRFKKIVQTISYLPHFISIVIVVGFLKDFFAREGFVNNMLSALGMEPQAFFQDPKWFRPLYVASDIWKGVGWGSIIYISTISSIDQEMYEAAIIDGATRFQRAMHITLPSISATIILMLIFRMGNILNVGFEKVFLMYNPSIYETADVISTFVYRRGLQGAQYGYAAAVGIFNSVVAFIMIVISNYVSRKFTEMSIW